MHKHDPSISRIFISYFWRDFANWPNWLTACLLELVGVFCSGFIARGKEELPKRDDLTERHTLSFFFSTRSESFSRFPKLWDTSLVIPRLPSCTHAIQLKAAKNRRCLALVG